MPGVAAAEGRVLVGVIADTHWEGPSWDPAPFVRLRDGLWRGVRTVLHAGDIGDVDWLFNVAFAGLEVIAVAGNCDATDDPRLPARRVLDLAGLRLGLIHGWGGPAGLPRKIAATFAGERLDAVVFGHSHQPYLATEGGVTYFNPGSPTSPRGAVPTVGRLEIHDGRARWEHLALNEAW